MNNVLNIIKEFLYALKTLWHNPYIKQRWAVISKPKVLVLIAVSYVVLTIGHFMFNLSMFIDLPNDIIWNYSFQTTYLQQQSFLFLFAAVVVPILVTIRIIVEKSKNRLSFVRLTPLSSHQVLVGLLASELLFLLIGVVLHLLLTLWGLFAGEIEYSYVIFMTFNLLVSALFFMSIGLVVGLLNKKLVVGIFTIFLLLGSHIFLFEYVPFVEIDKVVRNNLILIASFNDDLSKINQKLNKYFKLNDIKPLIKKLIESQELKNLVVFIKLEENDEFTKEPRNIKKSEQFIKLRKSKELIELITSKTVIDVTKTIIKLNTPYRISLILSRREKKELTKLKLVPSKILTEFSEL